MSYLIGIPKIALHPVDTAVSYYKRENFRKLTPSEKQLIDSSASSSSDEDNPGTMGINQRAMKNLNIFKTAVRVIGKFARTKRLKEIENKTKQIKRFYKAKYDEKTGKRGTPIRAPFSTPMMRFVPTASLVGKVVNVKTTDKGTERIIKAVPIVPGESLYLAREKALIQDAALMTQIREENLKIEQEAAAKKKKSKTKSKRNTILEETKINKSKTKSKRNTILEEAKINKSKTNGDKTASGTRKRRK
jgi:hypothetical protein